MKQKIKWMFRISLLIFAIILVGKLLNYEYWVNSPSSIPRDAILKYCSKQGLTYSSLNFTIQETNIVVTGYGNDVTFQVGGVTDENGSYISFLNLKETDGKWKVVSVGGGP